MSDDKRIVGSDEAVFDERTKTYSIQYYLSADELADYALEVGDVADWTPVSARITRSQKREAGPGTYIVTLEAEADASAGVFGGAGKIDIVDKFEWEYEDRQVYYHPKIWGVRRAAKNDVAKGAKNIYGGTAVEKDFIFKNYVNDPELQGSVNYDESPFSAENHPPISLLGHKRDAKYLIVVFYSEKSPKYLMRFAGVNGRFPAALEVYNSGIRGKWRLIKQGLKSYYSQDGKEHVKVTRTFGYAWGGLWDPDKCGGEWASWELGGTKEE